MSAIYYCNFSLFQSAPDIWAIDHLFPIMPIHRLDQEPTVPAKLADLKVGDRVVIHAKEPSEGKLVADTVQFSTPAVKPAVKQTPSAAK